MTTLIQTRKPQGAPGSTGGQFDGRGTRNTAGALTHVDLDADLTDDAEADGWFEVGLHDTTGIVDEADLITIESNNESTIQPGRGGTVTAYKGNADFVTLSKDLGAPEGAEHHWLRFHHTNITTALAALKVTTYDETGWDATGLSTFTDLPQHAPTTWRSVKEAADRGELAFNESEWPLAIETTIHDKSALDEYLSERENEFIDASDAGVPGTNGADFIFHRNNAAVFYAAKYMFPPRSLTPAEKAGWDSESAVLTEAKIAEQPLTYLLHLQKEATVANLRAAAAYEGDRAEFLQGRAAKQQHLTAWIERFIGEGAK